MIKEMGEERTRGCLRTMSPVHPVAAEHFLDIETEFGQIDRLLRKSARSSPLRKVGVPWPVGQDYAGRCVSPLLAN